MRNEGGMLRSPRLKRPTEIPGTEWVRDDAAPASVRKDTERVRTRIEIPADVLTDVRRSFGGTAMQRERTVEFLVRAAEAYNRHRFDEALRLMRRVADATPGVAAVRELTGLAAYRAERWSAARVHLRAHFALTADYQHLPLVMDCERALKRPRSVAATYEEIVGAEASADALAEARIVYAASLANIGKYDEAIALLRASGAAKKLRNPAFRHVRLWYTLGDVYDRAGDTASAREWFVRVVEADPEAYDARARLGELGSTRVTRRPRSVPPGRRKATAD
jgi:tetratricopeptide (TPR) repeat protein